MSDLLLQGDGPVLMGIVNVTPDSFSDGGKYFDPKKAIEHGLRLYAEGAKILDIGGESTRPGSVPVSVQEEQDRVIPVLEGLKGCGALLSVDTRNAAVMTATIEAGAWMVNDISALTHDPESLSVVANGNVHVCLMHMKGQPENMQDEPHYEDVFGEVYDYLQGRVDACVAAGMNRDRIVIDPGIGFGKTLGHNLTLMKRLGDFHKIGVPVLLGASRKRFIEAICPSARADQRLAGSIAACIAGYSAGIRLFRVHDVAETAQALAVYGRISSAS